MKSDFLVALTQLAAERNLPREIVLSAIEAALASAYRKDSIAEGQNISVKLDPGSGDVSVYVFKTVVDEVTEPLTEISLEDARKINPDAQIEGDVATENIPHIAGRIAAQTAKQVVMQRLREAERELVFEEFADKSGEVFAVNIQRMEPRQVVVDLGRAEAILPASEQMPFERYRPGQKMKVLLKSVERSAKGPELIVSRADKLLMKRLFELEVPEIFNGAVEIVSIAREPGSRSKVAVRARQTGVDPVGSCVGLRGVRIQNIVNELQGEKIDVVEWSKDVSRFIASSLSPSQVLRVDLDEETNSSVVVVPDRQLSLAIGREGQNARLAAKLTGWSVDIKSNVEVEAAPVEKPEVKAPVATAAAKRQLLEELVLAEPELAMADLESLGLSTRVVKSLKAASLTKVGDVLGMSKSELLGIKSFGQKSYDELSTSLHDIGAVAPEIEAKAEDATAGPLEEAREEPVTEEEAADGPVGAVAEPVGAEAMVEEPQPADSEPAAQDAAPSEVSAPEVYAEEVLAKGIVLEPEQEEGQEAVPAAEASASIRDVPEEVWSVRKMPTPEAGQIRFAEDIVGLRGGVTARRGGVRGDANQDRGRRKAKGGKKRFRRR